MALELSIDFKESNDNKKIIIKDTAGAYDSILNPTGWGLPNTEVSDVNGTYIYLSLKLTITKSNGKVMRSELNLTELYGPFSSPSDLVFEFNCSDFLMTTDEVSNVPLGSVDTEFPDGLYEIEYAIEGLGTSTVLTTLVCGKIRNAIYKLFRKMPNVYNCRKCRNREVLDVVFLRGYYDAMHASMYVSKYPAALHNLFVLERLVTNRCSYSWDI